MAGTGWHLRQGVIETMLDDVAQAEIKAVSRTLTIIVIALCVGVVTFGVVVFLNDAEDQEPRLGVLTMMSLAMAPLMLLGSVIVPRIVASGMARQVMEGKDVFQNNAMRVTTPAGKLALVYQTRTIIGCAMLEGVAFLGLMAYMTEQHVAALAVAAAMLIGVGLRIPVLDRVSEWVQQQLEMTPS